jgi:DNA-3-methyladenine glycosylase I
MIIDIQKATIAQLAEIARLNMMAMTDECCLHFCGKGHEAPDMVGLSSNNNGTCL